MMGTPGAGPCARAPDGRQAQALRLPISPQRHPAGLGGDQPLDQLDAGYDAVGLPHQLIGQAVHVDRLRRRIAPFELGLQSFQRRRKDRLGQAVRGQQQLSDVVISSRRIVSGSHASPGSRR